MAQPDNGHHVHDAGYESERGSVDTERMLVELADEVAQIDGVTDVKPTADRLVVEYTGESKTLKDVRWEVNGWSCAVTTTGDDWIEISPAD